MNLNGWCPWYNLESLAPDVCKAYLKWIIDGKNEGITGNRLYFLLAHCYDGVCWGRLNSDETWLLSSQVFEGVGTGISESNLLELRLFGNEQEILIWRSQQGFLGRVLSDKIVGGDNYKPCRPDDESRILLGNIFVKAEKGFTQIMTARRLQQAVPIECTAEDFRDQSWPLRLELRHYFEQDERTGMVRVAASRLKNVKMIYGR
jgi:CRISPR-associated protein (TIGR03984 family)